MKKTEKRLKNIYNGQHHEMDMNQTGCEHCDGMGDPPQ